MKNILMMLAWGALAAGCCRNTPPESLTTVSPDGRNEITLHMKPLSYEVKRDGVTVVAKTPIGIKINGRCFCGDMKSVSAFGGEDVGSQDVAIYKKGGFDRAQRWSVVKFGEIDVMLVARDDGVAYRFGTSITGEITVNQEKAFVTIPDAKARCWVNMTGGFGQEESVPFAVTACDLRTNPNDKKGWKGTAMAYLPFAYSVGGKFVVVTESDVHDYPIWNLVATNSVREGGVRLESVFACAPKRTVHVEGWKGEACERGGRWIRVTEYEDYLVKTKTKVGRYFPWRAFILADEPSEVLENDLVYALATPATGDFSWVKPGKVAWDWWNDFDNGAGCNTKTYERFIDFAAANGVEYVIMDEGWSESLNIWKFHPDVDVPHLIDYAAKKGVGIILWMAWAQVYGDEERVAEHFAKLGAKGFKVDFMDRGDAEVGNFLVKFAAACEKNRMLVDYHGVYRPVGLNRTYPNVVNYEGIHGLEQMKWAPADKDMTANDVMCAYLRMSAGPMDYTPGAMLNYPIGKYTAGEGNRFPGSVGTRCHQMAMMALYEAYLQMLCDSPTHYEKNMESFSFMAKVPVTWNATVALGGSPDTYVAVAREAKDGSWYAAGLCNRTAREVEIETEKFLGEGEWTAEIFRDAPESDAEPEKYVHETKTVKAGETLDFHLASGGGFIVKFTK